MKDRESDLKRIIAECLGVDEELVESSTDLCKTFNAEYLDLVEICEQLDEQLGVVIPDDYDLESLVIFADWVVLVNSLPAKRGRRAKPKEVEEVEPVMEELPV